MLAPSGYKAHQNLKATKKYYSYGVENHKTVLTYDVEHAIIRICEKEIASVKSVEPLKQGLMTYVDFSILEIFRHIDQFAHGKINADNLRVFFLGFPFCSDLDEEDIQNWIRRYDRDADMQLDYADFVTSLGPYCNFVQKADLKKPLTP